MNFCLPRSPREIMKEKKSMKCNACNHSFRACMLDSMKCPKCGSSDTKKKYLWDKEDVIFR